MIGDGFGQNPFSGAVRVFQRLCASHMHCTPPLFWVLEGWGKKKQKIHVYILLRESSCRRLLAAAAADLLLLATLLGGGKMLARGGRGEPAGGRGKPARERNPNLGYHRQLGMLIEVLSSNQ